MNQVSPHEVRSFERKARTSLQPFCSDDAHAMSSAYARRTSRQGRPANSSSVPHDPFPHQQPF